MIVALAPQKKNKSNRNYYESSEVIIPTLFSYKKNKRIIRFATCLNTIRSFSNMI